MSTWPHTPLFESLAAPLTDHMDQPPPLAATLTAQLTEALHAQLVAALHAQLAAELHAHWLEH